MQCFNYGNFRAVSARTTQCIYLFITYCTHHAVYLFIHHLLHAPRSVFIHHLLNYNKLHIFTNFDCSPLARIVVKQYSSATERRPGFDTD
jgi:hypothetical protein